MKLKSITAALTAAGLSLMASAQAALVFVETTDLSNNNDNSSTFVGTFMPGLNSISGSLGGECVATSGPRSDCDPFGGSTDTQDAWRVDLTDSLSLTSAELTISNFSGPDGFTFNILSTFQGGGVAFFELNNGGDATFPVTLFQSVPNTLSSTLMLMTIFGDSADTIGNYSFDWQFNFNISEIDPAPVPVPGAIWMMLAGLGGIGWLKRRKAAIQT